MEKEICLVDNCTTNNIFREVRYFQTLTKREGMVLTSWTQCYDSMFWKDHYHTSNGYTNTYRGGIVVSRFNSYPTKL